MGGRKVSVFCRNRLEWVLSLWRCECAGGVKNSPAGRLFCCCRKTNCGNLADYGAEGAGVELSAVWTASVSGGWQTLELNDAFSDV